MIFKDRILEIALQCNAQDNWESDLSSYGQQTHTHAALLSAKKYRIGLKAFCQNPVHSNKQTYTTGENNYYQVRGLDGKAYAVKATKQQVNCDTCGTALFWSRKYRRMDMSDEQEIARLEVHKWIEGPQELRDKIKKRESKILAKAFFTATPKFTCLKAITVTVYTATLLDTPEICMKSLDLCLAF